jgi:mRNA interferase HigB
MFTICEHFQKLLYLCMKVHLIRRETVEAYVARHAPGRSSFEYWLSTIKYADWDEPEDIRRTFGTADLLGNGSDRVVFDIGGNNYRLIAKYYFGDNKVHLFIMWIGTHAEYDAVCENGNQYTVSDY